MKAKQRHDLATNALARELEGLPDKLKRWANTLLTVILVGAAVFMLVHWRMDHAEQARQEILGQLSTAQTSLEQLGRELDSQPRDYVMTHPQAAAEFVAHSRAALTAQARDAITTVLNNSDDPKLKAQAMIARGDLYWKLANFASLPGATTQPFLRPDESTDQYLTHAAEAYQQVLNDDAYKQQHDAIVSARFGLAAIDENRHDWTSAQKHLQAIVDDTDVTGPLHDLAVRQIAALPTLQTSLYLSPATQPTVAASPPTPLLPTTQPMH